MENLINLYNDDQSAIIIDETSTNLVSVESFNTLGHSPFSSGDSIDAKASNNQYFIELHIFDEDDSHITTLCSGKPLLEQPSTGKYYFGDYHIHQETYMVGKKHTAAPHETLSFVKPNQILPYPLENKFNFNESQKFAIKTSEIFEVLSKLSGFRLEPNNKFIIKYAVFQDALLVVRNYLDYNPSQGGGGT